jgi:hypothetical protein
MSNIVVICCVIDAEIGGETVNFIGVGVDSEEAYQRAIKNLHDDEYLKCVHYVVVATHFGIL